MDKVKQAEKLFNEIQMYSTKWIKKCWDKDKQPYLVYCDRWYGSYDSPDWTYHFKVTEEEAKEIVRLGYGRYR